MFKSNLYKQSSLSYRPLADQLQNMFFGVNDIKLFYLFLTKSGACTIKNYGLVIYGKWTNFVVSQHLYYHQSLALVWTNTLAYNGTAKLRIRNVFMVQAPVQYRLVFQASPMFAGQALSPKVLQLRETLQLILFQFEQRRIRVLQH